MDPSFASILDWSTFSIRIPERDAARVVRILREVSPERVEAMQDALGKVWHRFAYLSHPAEVRKAHEARQVNEEKRAGVAAAGFASRPHPYTGDLVKDDAFNTIIQWLHSRVLQNLRISRTAVAVAAGPLSNTT